MVTRKTGVALSTETEKSVTGQALVGVSDWAVEVRGTEVHPVGEWDIRVRLERSAIGVGEQDLRIGPIRMSAESRRGLST